MNALHRGGQPAQHPIGVTIEQLAAGTGRSRLEIVNALWSLEARGLAVRVAGSDAARWIVTDAGALLREAVER